MPDATEDRFLGCLLGLAIGDALGMPIGGYSPARIAAELGTIDRYHGRTFADETEIKAGEFTDETEIALCIVESLTTNDGEIDVENIGSRLLYLARGESKRWMSADTLAALEAADRTLQFAVPIDEDGPATGEVAARGVPIGLFHAVGDVAPDRLRRDAEAVVRLTHGSPAATAAALAVAFGVRLAARGETPRDQWANATAEFLGSGEVADGLRRVDALLAAGRPVADVLAAVGTGPAAAKAVPAAFAAAMTATVFEEAVFRAVNMGGDADTIGAIAGALAGAADGASGIPQGLIDDLEGRIYISLAAPWFYRAARRQAGLATAPGPWDMDSSPPRPAFPPRV